ncbi:hypothetical protein EMCRGX_G009787 [Ephydatia muelleri]
MVGVVIHRELYLYLPLSSPAASLNLTGVVNLGWHEYSVAVSNKFKSQLLTTSSSSVTRLTPIKLRMDYITATWKEGLENCCTQFCPVIMRSRTSYGYNREQKEENWNRHPSEVTQA